MSTVRFGLRALAIFSLVLFALVRFFVGWVVLFVLFAPRDRRQEWFARCVVGLFRALGATFVKVGQIMSTRPDLFPPHLIARARDAAGQRRALSRGRTCSGRSSTSSASAPEDVFAEISPVPIASASVAQVHRAQAARTGASSRSRCGGPSSTSWWRSI